ncbi:hypothetical protein [Actinoallomurus acaciae]|uniref:Uncharacterized protein n=1 Tax=Actinoallomurus acaciae TaxID=502577 RepID=A0ABV5Y7K7_9ACTN
MALHPHYLTYAALDERLDSMGNEVVDMVFDVVLAVAGRAFSLLSAITQAFAQVNVSWQFEHLPIELVGNRASRTGDGFVVEIGRSIAIGDRLGR